MKEDDGNPHAKHLSMVTDPKILHPQHKAWNEGDEHGQQNPSPQTIRKIQTKTLEDFVFSLKEAIKHKWLGWEYIESDLGKVKVGKGEITLHEIYEAIDNILKECEED